RFVQPELVGDLPQGQRPHREIAVLEEIALPGDDSLRDSLDGEKALLEIANEPARLLQVLGEERRLAFADLPELLGILLIDADAGIDRGVDRDEPALLLLPHDHVRDDRARLEGAELRAGPRIETADQIEGDVQLLVRAAERLLKLLMVARRDQLELALRDGERECPPRRPRLEPVELQREAFREITGGDTGRLESLHDPQRRLELARGDRADTPSVVRVHRHELGKRLAHESVLVERIDDQVRERE